MERMGATGLDVSIRGGSLLGAGATKLSWREGAIMKEEKGTSLESRRKTVRKPGSRGLGRGRRSKPEGGPRIVGTRGITQVVCGKKKGLGQEKGRRGKASPLVWGLGSQGGERRKRTRSRSGGMNRDGGLN